MPQKIKLANDDTSLCRILRHCAHIDCPTCELHKRAELQAVGYCRQISEEAADRIDELLQENAALRNRLVEVNDALLNQWEGADDGK